MMTLIPDHISTVTDSHCLDFLLYVHVLQVASVGSFGYVDLSASLFVPDTGRSVVSDLLLLLAIEYII